jgi:DGQHR domain-containing protein
MATKRTRLEAADEVGDVRGRGFAARLITQGRHRFFTATMPSDLLAQTCTVESRLANPLEGFQRKLDEKRAEEIAAYIDSGFGTIPCSIVLSAQEEAQMKYDSKTQVLSFKRVPGAFLILDGQHRVYGFHKAKTSLRVPVVIYNELSRSEEARLFIDINTKQRPVPTELLLDIKRMADAETDVDALHTDVFDKFEHSADSPLLGLMSPSTRSKGKISRVTFRAAMNSISRALEGDADWIYSVLCAYLTVWAAELRKHDAHQNLTNSTMFRAIFLLFPAVAERVNDRHRGTFTSATFGDVLAQCFSRVKKVHFRTPGASPVALASTFEVALKTGFTIGKR